MVVIIESSNRHVVQLCFYILKVSYLLFGNRQKRRHIDTREIMEVAEHNGKSCNKESDQLVPFDPQDPFMGNK